MVGHLTATVGLNDRNCTCMKNMAGQAGQAFHPRPRPALACHSHLALTRLNRRPVKVPAMPAPPLPANVQATTEPAAPTLDGWPAEGQHVAEAFAKLRADLLALHAETLAELRAHRLS